MLKLVVEKGKVSIYIIPLGYHDEIFFVSKSWISVHVFFPFKVAHGQMWIHSWISTVKTSYVIVRYWDSTKGCPRVLDRGQVCVKTVSLLRDLTVA